MGALCCHATRVPIQSAQNPMQPFPISDDALHEYDHNWTINIRGILL